MNDGFGWHLLLRAVAAGIALCALRFSQGGSFPRFSHPLPMASEQAGAWSSHGSGRDTRS